MKYDDGDVEDYDCDEYADAHEEGLALTTIPDTESLQDKKIKATLRPALEELTVSLLVSGVHKCPTYLFGAGGYEFCLLQIYFNCLVLMSLIEFITEEGVFCVFFTQ